MRAICPVPIWLIGLSVLVTGCTNRTNHWHEDVQLSDGSVLTVERARAFQLTGQLGAGSGWRGVQEQLSLKDPATGRTTRWSAANRSAAALDQVEGRFWLVASSNDCYPDMKGQRLLQVYVLDGLDWTRIEPDQAPPIVAPNLVRWPSYENSRLWDHVNLQMQREMLDVIAEKWMRPELLSLDLMNSRRC